MKDKINYGLTAFIAFILGGLVMYYFNSTESYTTTQNNNVNSISSENVGDVCNDDVVVSEISLSSAIDQVYDAVVMVNTYQGNKVANTGSGFVYKTDEQYGYVMTNHHVIDGGSKWSLYLSDDTEIEATVLGSDEYLDLAVMRIAKSDVKAVAAIGKDSECKLGDNVLAIGSPLGYEYRGTVTNGIISGLNRLVEVSVKSSSEDWVMEVIQTNAAVNPGNSGGPLVNTKGEVIGVISLKLVQDSVEGMGFAIPIETAMSYSKLLESGKKIDRPLLGINMMNVADSVSLSRYHGIKIDSSIESGVVVVEITKDSAASKSALQKGDIITKINDDEIENTAYLKYLLYKYNIGDTVEFTYYRDGKYKTTKITLVKNNG